MKPIPQQLEPIIESVVGKARINLQIFGRLLPVFFILKDGDRPEIIGAPFTNDAEKDRTAAIVKAKIIERHADHVFFLCEAWISEAAAKSPLGNGGRTMNIEDMPRNQMDRREVVQFVLLSRSGEHWAAMCPILRAKQVTFLEPDWIYSDHAPIGRFIELF